MTFRLSVLHINFYSLRHNLLWDKLNIYASVLGELGLPGKQQIRGVKFSVFGHVALLFWRAALRASSRMWFLCEAAFLMPVTGGIIKQLYRMQTVLIAEYLQGYRMSFSTCMTWVFKGASVQKWHWMEMLNSRRCLRKLQPKALWLYSHICPWNSCNCLKKYYFFTYCEKINYLCAEMDLEHSWCVTTSQL